MGSRWHTVRQEVQEYLTLSVEVETERQRWCEMMLDTLSIEKRVVELEKTVGEGGIAILELREKALEKKKILPSLDAIYKDLQRKLEQKAERIKRALVGLNKNIVFLTTMDTDALCWIKNFSPENKIRFTLGRSVNVVDAESMKRAVYEFCKDDLNTMCNYEFSDGCIRAIGSSGENSDTGTRKRRNVTLLATATFENEVIDIYHQSNGDLNFVAKRIEESELDFSTNGDTFFEVVFFGGCIRLGRKRKPDVPKENSCCILGCDSRVEDILPFIKYLQNVFLVKPFLLDNLEKITSKMLGSLNLLSEKEIKNLALFTSLAFTERLFGLQPATVFRPLVKDDLVEKELVLSFITDFFKQYLLRSSPEDLKSILKRGKVEDKLLNFLPVAKRTHKAFSKHFTKAGLLPLVEHYWNQIFEEDVESITDAVMIPKPKEEILKQIESARQHVKEAEKNDDELMGIVWKALMGAVDLACDEEPTVELANWQVNTWKDMLLDVCSTKKLNRILLYKIQDWCYEDNSRNSSFPRIVRCLYDEKVLTKTSVLYWYDKGKNEKGRESLMQLLLPFVEQLKQMVGTGGTLS